MAYEGMRFQWAYAEPSCTPSRIAINTGWHPVRTGVKSVMFPGESLGLPPEEVTIAEVLKKAGYDTATWGKWHMGELPKHAPENQGYDYTYYGLVNGGHAEHGITLITSGTLDWKAIELGRKLGSRREQDVSRKLAKTGVRYE
jgi:arylsulfatase A-like enzyme